MIPARGFPLAPQVGPFTRKQPAYADSAAWPIMPAARPQTRMLQRLATNWVFANVQHDKRQHGRSTRREDQRGSKGGMRTDFRRLAALVLNDLHVRNVTHLRLGLHLAFQAPPHHLPRFMRTGTGTVTGTGTGTGTGTPW